MDSQNVFPYNQTPNKTVTTIRFQVLDTLHHANHGTTKSKHEHLTKLEKLIESFHLLLCGNFFVSPFKETMDDFRFEDEFIKQNLLGYFIFNLNKFNEKICQNFVKIFVHIIEKYAYRTRKPFVEKFEIGGRVLIDRLFHFLATEPDVSFYAATMLCKCCQQKTLAFKIIDFIGLESESNVPVYTTLFQILIRTNDFNHLIQIFKVLKELFLANIEVAKYAFDRDLHALIDAFNRIFRTSSNYYTRLTSIDLFGQLIQNRNLQKLIHQYTGDVENFKLICSLMKKAESKEKHCEEFVKLFEVIRLFILNPGNQTDDKPFKQAFINEYNSLEQAIGKAQRIRSFTDVALFTPEYKDVLFWLKKITGNIDRSASLFTMDEYDVL